MNVKDVIIIGGGPAGLTAAIYLSRAKYRVLVLEKEHHINNISQIPLPLGALSDTALCYGTPVMSL